MRIAVYAFDGATMFHLAVPQMVFDEVARQGLAGWKTALFSDREGGITSAEGYRLGEVQGPEAADAADVVVVPSWFDDGRVPSDSLRRVLQGRTGAGRQFWACALARYPSRRRIARGAQGSHALAGF